MGVVGLGEVKTRRRRKTMKLIAHVRKKLDSDEWDEPHYLKDHLEGTARLAAGFAAKFGSEDWGNLLGAAHDTGKGTENWQKYLFKKSGYDAEQAHLEGVAGKLDHSGPSAKFAEMMLPKHIGRILSYCVAGHHAGLPDWFGNAGSLSFRLENADVAGISEEFGERLKSLASVCPPGSFDELLSLSLWIRMLFSCLVDADFLDTEAYMDSQRAQSRGGYLSISTLLERFNSYMAEKTANSAKTPVNTIRKQILEECCTAAEKQPGIFSLTVPTGGGKTLSSLAFGLEHAKKYNLDRIIYVIPYTSIIEQNSDVFKEAVGEDQVIEHHSALDENDSTARSRLAAENWDAPVVVTTSVQFFESLFASKTSRCRKLHNIANSVVVLDEAQLIPVEYLSPILLIMDLLSKRYNVTFVISTATQPALQTKGNFKGLGEVTEIISDVPNLYHQLHRVDVEFPKDLKSETPLPELARMLDGHQRVLCVVSDRKTCRELYELMPVDTYHLSALMCGQHRSNAIAEIKAALKKGGPVRVISTQLVEAGVDLDFPVVYRAMAGLDSIAQAAGRCNREGKLNGKGKVFVFIAPRKAPPGVLRKAMYTTLDLIQAGLPDPMAHEVFNKFFEGLYGRANSLDEKEIVRLLKEDRQDLSIQFREAARKFKLINDSDQHTVIVRYGESEKWIRQLERFGPSRNVLRKLQRYAVTVYSRDFNAMLARDSIVEIVPGVFYLDNDIEYSKKTGLLVDELPTDPNLFVL